MNTEDEILKTLQSIEKTIKTSSVFSTAKVQYNKNNGAENKNEFKAVTASIHKTGDVVLALSKNLNELQDEVHITTSNFSALNSELARFMSSLKNNNSEKSTNEDTDKKDLQKNSVLDNAKALIKKLFGSKDAEPKPVIQTNNSSTTLAKISEAPIKANEPEQQKESTVPGGIISRVSTAFGKLGVTTAGVTTALSMLGTALIHSTADYFKLSAVGMGSVDNLSKLYVSAAKAGMSFDEYSSLLYSARSVLVKAGSLDNFDKIISGQDAVLANFGVFGIESRQLQASLANSAATLGISINDISTSNNAMAKTFGELHKTVNLTTQEFSDLVKHVADNRDVQTELVGIAPRQRAARMAEMVQLQTMGLQLGMTATASKALGDALIKQRQATISERINTSGALIQAAAISGNSDLAGRALELSLNKKKTASESAEFANIIGRISSGIEGLAQSNDFSRQILGEAGQKILKDGVDSELLDGSNKAVLAKDVGVNNQEAFGKNVSAFGQAVAQFSTFISGIQKSVLGPIIGGIGIGIAGIFSGPILKSIGSNLIKFFTPAKSALVFPTIEGAAVAGNASKLGTAFQSVSNIFAKMFQSVSKIGSALPSIGTAFQSVSNFFSAFIKSAGAFMQKLPLIGAFISAGFELITGDLTDALNPSGGIMNRIGNAIASIFTALPQFIIDSLKFIFGPGADIQRGFDMFTSWMVAAVKSWLSGLISDVGAVLKWILPKDSGLVKMIDRAAEGLQNSADENFAAFDKLWNNQSATLASIAKDENKKQENQNRVNKDTAKQGLMQTPTFNNVVSADNLSHGSIIQDVKTLSNSPTVQTAQPVQNTTRQNTENTNPQIQPEQLQQVQYNSDIVNTLTAMLQVLRDSLSTETKQADDLSKLVSIAKNKNVDFISSETNFGNFVNNPL